MADTTTSNHVLERGAGRRWQRSTPSGWIIAEALTVGVPLITTAKIGLLVAP